MAESNKNCHNVRGGVYRVVRYAMGSTAAKFSVSALMFDYVLTGPISAVSAGLYLAGLLNETAQHFRLLRVQVPGQLFAAGFAFLVTLYFWHTNRVGIPIYTARTAYESSIIPKMNQGADFPMAFSVMPPT